MFTVPEQCPPNAGTPNAERNFADRLQKLLSNSANSEENRVCLSANEQRKRPKLPRNRSFIRFAKGATPSSQNESPRARVATDTVLSKTRTPSLTRPRSSVPES